MTTGTAARPRSAGTPRRGRFSRLVRGRVRTMAWVTLVAQIAIVGTGGLVRLTGSGLGCPTWPQCTEGSFVTTPEMGVHGVIEFGNRLLTVALVVIAVWTILATLAVRKSRRDLFVLAIVLACYIPIQIVLGGITVLTGLNPYAVGLHFLASVVIVAFAAVFVVRAYAPWGPRVRAVPGWYAGLAHTTSAAVLVTVLVGILVTASGPHAGDSGTRRTGLDPGVLQYVHSWPGYLTLALTIALVVGSFRMPAQLHLRRWTGILLAVEIVQIVVGIAQARLGLPIALVNIHMVLAVCLVAAMTVVVMNLKRVENRAESTSAAASPVVTG